ncbi:MAG: nucleotidyltransferase domain-containing protein [Gammaproteobacteria bacterium]
MNRQQMIERSESYLRELLRANLPPGTPVYLFGSRARGDGRWNSDFDLWIDADVDPSTLSRFGDVLEESFVPFHVDFVTTRQLAGQFGAAVRQEAKRWM